jgi:endonuclease-3 related protein
MTKLAPTNKPPPKPSVATILDDLESFYGPQQPTWPTDPYLFLVWWHCGYPASDAACIKGWLALNATVGTTPEALLTASPDTLAAALKPGGMVPELRAMRLKEIALRVKNECGGDLHAALHGPVNKAASLLRKFPNIAGPGADRILLFAHIAPVAAIPSNCPQVLVRIMLGLERENYNVTYNEAQNLVATNIPATFDARTRAYLLLKQHGQTLCKRTKPKCEQCPINASCAFFAGKTRGRVTVS